MRSFSLKLASSFNGELDMSFLTPDSVANTTVDKLQRHRVRLGKRTVTLGDLFSIEENPEHSHMVHFRGTNSQLIRIGQRLSAGSIVVSGSAGRELGAEMTGGTITLSGNAGDFAGAGMRGGELRIRGRAGAFAGGSLPGAAHGMRGGVLCLGSGAGDRLGDKMRRGLIVANGDVGEYCASNIIAGTVVLTGASGDHLAYGMRRGTILCASRPQHIAETFNDCGNYSLAFIKLFTNHLREVDRKSHAVFRNVTSIQRYTGDLGAGGQGEILIAMK